jgi:2-dehydropantoate 2-reductase
MPLAGLGRAQIPFYASFEMGGKGMKPRIAIVGAGAVGLYAGGHMAQAGEDVTFIDFWPDNVATLRASGARISHIRDVPEFTVPVSAIDVTEVQSLAKQRPIDIAFICVKSYDTAWATTMIAQYLSPGGFVVSLQNCMNEETIASVVGWGRTMGSIASSITVELCEAGHVRRASGKGGARHTVFRAGEVHGRITDRAETVCRLLAYADSAMITTNLWGERWSKLVTNVMGNGLSACTGLLMKHIVADDRLRHFSARLGSEAIRVGQALGYQLEDILHMPPETVARAGEGDQEATRAFDDHRIAEASRGDGEHRPSMGQDMQKGRRTEIDFLNGFVASKGAEIGLPTLANAALTDIVKKVERGELAPNKQHILDLRLN